MARPHRKPLTDDPPSGSCLVLWVVSAGTFSKEFSDYRTSYNAWCNMHPCVTSKVTKTIQNKIADVTMTEVKHQEFLQVLQYEPDQYYKKHHDFIPGQVQMPCGPRIFTAFMYFNDVEEGGETKVGEHPPPPAPCPGNPHALSAPPTQSPSV